MGILGGLVSSLFSLTLSLVTGLRAASPWVILLLPLGGIATIFLYRAFNMAEDGSTNRMILCLKDNREIRPIAAPLIFVSTAITHLFGGSAGKEGAAIQLGGAMASGVSGLFRLKDDERTVAIMSGMSAVFAGAFGTPFTATFFILEFKLGRKIASLAFLPCLISALTAKTVSSFMGVSKETVPLSGVMPFSFGSATKVLVLSMGIYLLGNAMCFLFRSAKDFPKRLIPNPLFRSVLGAAILIVLTACVGDMRYNGSGIDMALSAVEGNAAWFDFILKILFTSVTLAAGFKGGEIVPTFCAGATFGCVFGSMLGLDAGFAAALGLTGLFCCAANSPVGAVFLGIELFGWAALPYFIMICILLWLLPLDNGLFENRFFRSPLLNARNK